MLTPVMTNSFEKEVKLAIKRGKDISKLKSIITKLVNEIPLPQKNKDHPLIGNYSGRRECHIEPDWVLIYKINGSKVIFERTGSHSDLFK